MRRRYVPRRAVLSLLAAAVPAAGAMAMSAAPARLRLECPSDAPEALCAALAQALAEAAPDRSVWRDAGTPAHPDDIAVRLEIAGQGGGWIAARLHWRDGTGAGGAGPVTELSMMDAAMASARLARLALVLVRSAPDLHAALGRQTRRP